MGTCCIQEDANTNALKQAMEGCPTHLSMDSFCSGTSALIGKVPAKLTKPSGFGLASWRTGWTESLCPRKVRGKRGVAWHGEALMQIGFEPEVAALATLQV